ncbi:MAG: SdiA-regulated domain-containing protein [Flavobacteriales bacterium]|nr:SdiA-regulated domain-containing protein [Flavobacteriales bacterium]
MRLVLLLLSFIFSAVINLQAQKNDNNKTSFESYDFSNPQQAWILPDRLEEISGITSYAENTIACVNDEEGVIFLWDTKWASVKRKIKFAYYGDYEGITYIKPYFYVINSEGLLFRYNEETDKLKKHQLPFEWDNQIEGLCIESDTTLFLVLRDASGLYGKEESYNGIYRYNINSKKTELAFKLELDHEVGLSGICINKEKSKVFVISHRRSNELIVFSLKTGEVESIVKLDLERFPQPEGICFDSEGNLFISNEISEDDNSTLYKF